MRAHSLDESVEVIDEELQRLEEEATEASQRGLNRRKPMKKSGGFIGKRKLIGHDVRSAAASRACISRARELARGDVCLR